MKKITLLLMFTSVTCSLYGAQPPRKRQRLSEPVYNFLGKKPSYLGRMVAVSEQHPQFASIIALIVRSSATSEKKKYLICNILERFEQRKQ